MDWPLVWVLFTTYKRTRTAIRAARALLQNLTYPSLHYHICDEGSGETDDGSGRNHIATLADVFGAGCTWHDVQTPRRRFNLGGNANEGIKAARHNGAFIYLVVEDDTVLDVPLDLRPFVDILDNHGSVGYIRFNYLCAGLAGEVVGYEAPRLHSTYPFLRLRRAWSTNHYIPAFNPALLHYRFIEAYGWYPEHLHPGLTETRMCDQYALSNHEDGPQVLAPICHWPRDIRWLHAAGRAHDYKAFSEGKMKWDEPK